MRVLLINSVVGYGSTGRIVQSIYTRILEEGNEAMVIFGRGDIPKNINSLKISSNLDIYIHVMLSRLLDKQGFLSTRKTKNIIKKIKEYDPDIIHLHNLHGYYINVSVLFDYLIDSGKRVIITMHDCWNFTGHCTHFVSIDCEKWKTHCHKCPLKMEYPRSYFLDSSYKNFEKKKNIFSSISNLTIITPSFWLKSLTTESIMNKHEIVTINNGIDLSIFRPVHSDFKAKYGLENKKIILGVSNVWNKKKGFDVFIKLSSVLDSKYQIVLVGLSFKQVQNLPENIIGFTKTNDINDLVKIYSSADLFINPTLEDTFPTVNIEALACGVPVITYNTGGSPEIIDDTCGIVITSNNFVDLVNSIISFDYSSILRENAVRRAQKYDEHTMLDKYIDLYNKIEEVR